MPTLTLEPPEALRKCNSHNTLLAHNEREIHPLLNVERSLPIKDSLDGSGGWNVTKKHKKSASSSSFVYEEKRKKLVPPWEVTGSDSSTSSYASFVANALPAAEKTWDVDTLRSCHFDLDGPGINNALVNACRRGHFEVINSTLSSVGDYIVEDDGNLKAFCVAAYCDRGDVLEKLAESWQLKHRLLRISFKEESVSILHLMCHVGCLSSVRALIECDALRISPDVKDSRHWTPLHYASSQGHVNIVKYLLQKQSAYPDSEGPFRVCPLHVAAYRNFRDIVHTLIDGGADPSRVVSVINPRFSNNRARIDELPDVVQYNSTQYSTLLHWAVVHGDTQLIDKMLKNGSSIHSLDSEGKTPLGLALTDGREETVKCIAEKGIRLSEGDKNWRRVEDEETGNKVIRCLLATSLEALDCSGRDSFSLLHLAASKGYLSMLIYLLSHGVNPDLETIRGETPIFCAIENNHQACVHELMKKECHFFHLNKKNTSILHVAAKYNNFSAIDMILRRIRSNEKQFINLTDDSGYTAIYYAISESRFDIVQRFVHFCICESMHIKATEEETLLQFYTERNILGQYDNAIVRVIELEKELHSDKFIAEKCLRTQLGTTLASTKAREQLQAMYEPLQIQRHCWNFWIILSCFLMPSFLYYLDVFTDVVLAVEYYSDYMAAELNCSNQTYTEECPEAWDQRVNFLLTVFFILFPMTLLTIWSLYVHITQPDIIPAFKRMISVQRIISYIFLFIPPIGPMISYIENTYAQIKYINVTTESSKSSYHALSLLSVAEAEADVDPKGKKTDKEKLRIHYNLKHIAQMRVAINNVLEATLESAFQLVLQLYIVGTQYSDLKKLHLGDLTIGSILSFSPTEDSQSRLSKQVASVLISLVSLTWSFTSYHRFSKLGGLRILWSLPLLFAIFFQIISRAIACTVFTLAYGWRIFIVLGIHFFLVLLLKTFFEKRSSVPRTAFFSSNKCYSSLRPYFYVILGSFTSTLVYFRIVRPQDDKDQLSERHSTFIVQIMFLALVLTENTVLIAIGVVALDPADYDDIFKVVSITVCLISFIIGLILQWVYYGCFGHPWVNINGPSFGKDAESGAVMVTFYRQDGQRRWFLHSCFDCPRDTVEHIDNVYLANEDTNKYLKLNGLKSS